MLELYFTYHKPSYPDYYLAVLNQYGFEGVNEAMPNISLILDAMNEVKQIEKGMVDFITKAKQLPKYKDRKELASHIFASYGKTDRANMLFTVLDHGVLNDKENKKLLFQCLAKKSQK